MTAIQRSRWLPPYGAGLQATPRPETAAQHLLVGIGRFLFGLCGLLAVWLGWAAPAAADVSPTGAFQTSVPIKVPPFHGLEPRLGLSYSSSTPNGWMGAGWSLTGLSTIRRHSKELGLPQWDTSDVFALDGQRLLACPPKDSNDRSALAHSPSCAYRLLGRPPSAPPLSAYTTRVESFQRIASEGDPYRVPEVTSPPEGDDRSAARWLVWRTDGVKATYEPGLVTSRGVLEWRLTRVEDLSGNTVSYQWTPAQGAQVGVLEAIRYEDGDVEIRFQRETRPDPLTIATGAGVVQNATRLRAIEEFAGGKLIRGYALTYRPADSDRPHRQSFMASVQQYGSEGIGGSRQSRLPATVFTSGQATVGGWAARTPPANVADWATGWPAGPDDSARFAATLNGGTQGSVPWPDFNDTSFEWLSADLNGDRRTDFALIKPAPPFSFEVQIELTQPDGGYRQVPIVLSTQGNVDQKQIFRPFVSDVNGDGIDDLTVAFGDRLNRKPELNTLFGRGDWTGPPDFGTRAFPEADGSWLMGDVTGDGFADLVALGSGNANCQMGVRVGIGAGTGWGFDFSTTKTACWSPQPHPRFFDYDQFGLADVNGDLVADVVGFLPAITLPDWKRPHALGFTAISDGTGGFLRTDVLDTGKAWAETDGVCKRCKIPPSCHHACEVVTTIKVPPVWPDVDGDGRSDLVVLRPGALGKVEAWTWFAESDGTYRSSTRSSTTGATPFDNDDLLERWVYTSSGRGVVSYPWAQSWLPGDFDGDGVTDLASVTGRRTLRALSDRRGNWTALPVSTRDWSTQCAGQKCGPTVPAMAGDANADGRTDVFFAHFTPVPHAAPWSGLDVDPSPALPGAAQLLSGDVNADGRQDLLYPTMTPDGVHVRVFHQRADDSYAPVRAVSVPVGGAHLAQGGWLVADIDGDRRVDLVNLDREVRVLVSGTDWQLIKTEDVTLPPSGRWAVADINGDERDDLVRVGPSSVRSGAVEAGVLVLFGQSNGSVEQEWTPSTVFGRGGLQVHTLDWHTVNLDGDRKSDLVYVDSRTGRIQTLLRRDSGWQSVPASVPISSTPPAADGPKGSNDVILSTGDDPAWRGLDVNGDGAGDLARVSVDRAGKVVVETLVGDGAGHYQPQTTMARTTRDPPATGPDSLHWVPADVDHDGRGDFVRVVSCRGEELEAQCGGRSVIQTLFSDGADGWVLHTWPDTAASSLPATSAWRIGDVDGNGQAAALRLDASSDGLTVSGYDSTTVADHITSVANGLGATTSILYQPGSSMLDPSATTPSSCRLPSGASATPVVARLTTEDHSTDSSDSTTVRYGCPGYSAELRSLVSWRHTWTTHQAAENRPASTRHVIRDIFSSGIVQPIAEEFSRSEEDGKPPELLRQTSSVYERLSEGSSADPVEDQPQRDLLTSRSVTECAQGVCATSTVEFGDDQVLGHDEFGNITSEIAAAAGSGRQRRTETAYLYDYDKWLVALPHRSRTVDPADPERLLRATLTCYDNDTSTDCGQLPVGARGLATRTRSWDDRERRYVDTGAFGYDQYGNQTAVTDGNHNTTTTVFDPQLHLYPIEICNAHKPQPHCTKQPLPWDRRADAPLLVIDPNGAKTHHTYDALGRLETITHPSPDTTTYPSGAVDRFTYQSCVTWGTNTTRTTSAPGMNLWSRTFTDGLGRAYLVERPAGDGDRVVLEATQYSDGSSRPHKIARPVFNDKEDEEPVCPEDGDGSEGPNKITRPFLEGAEPVWESMHYDAVGRLIRQVHGDQKHTEISRSYVVRNGLREIEDRDETGRTQTHLYDGWGALVRTEQPSIIPDRKAATRYTYNAVGDLTEITDPAENTIRNDYDTLGRQRAEHDPDRGTTRYRYDQAGNLRRQRDARDRVLVFDYDELNRPIRKHDLATDAVSRWVYDEPGHGDGRLGRLTSVHDPSADGCQDQTSRSLSYDLVGNLTGESRCVRGATVAFTSRYDPLGRLASLTYPDGEQLTYTYDQAGLLTGVSGYLEELRYNAANQPVFARYANHTQASWHYSPTRGWLEDQTLVDSANASLFDSHHGHEANGLVSSTHSTSNDTDEDYGYDPLGRLSTVDGTWQQELHYDDLGNLTSNSHLGTYHYPLRRDCIGQGSQQSCAGPHAVTDAGGASYHYDASGNMTSAPIHPAPTAASRYTVKARQPGKRGDTLWAIAADQLGDPRRWPQIFALNKDSPYPKPPGGRFTNPHRILPGQRLLLPAAPTAHQTSQAAAIRTFTWNSEGQLTTIDDPQAGQVENRYDADGSRVQQTTRNGVKNFYGRLADWTPTAGLTKYIYAGPMLVARHQNNIRLWYTLDRLGSPRLLTNQAGHPTSRSNYAPFGQRINHTGDPDPVGYTGHHAIGDTDLIDMVARAYDPHLARMLSADSIIPDTTNPQALNRYSYVYNNPITYTDPTGHLPANLEHRPMRLVDAFHRELTWQEKGERPDATRVHWRLASSTSTSTSTEKDNSSKKITTQTSTATTSGQATGTTGQGNNQGNASQAPPPDKQTPATNGSATNTAAASTGSNNGSGTGSTAASTGSNNGSGTESTPSEPYIDMTVYGPESFASSPYSLGWRGNWSGPNGPTGPPINPWNLGRWIHGFLKGTFYFIGQYGKGFAIGGGGQSCFGPCVAAGQAYVGLFFEAAGPSDILFGEVKLFVSGGGAMYGLTPGPKGPQTAWGVGSSVGGGVQFFVTEETTVKEFGGYSRNTQVDLPKIPFSFGYGTNPEGKRNWSFGVGPGVGIGSFSRYNDYTP